MTWLLSWPGGMTEPGASEPRAGNEAGPGEKLGVRSDCPAAEGLGGPTGRRPDRWCGAKTCCPRGEACPSVDGASRSQTRGCIHERNRDGGNKLCPTKHHTQTQRHRRSFMVQHVVQHPGIRGEDYFIALHRRRICVCICLREIYCKDTGTRPAGSTFQARSLFEQSALEFLFAMLKTQPGKEYTSAKLHLPRSPSPSKGREGLALEGGMEW
ncbi:uncharacterized protein LOC111170390 [Delphinapterus leucas]|uniref:Uncharacterized protein LOC111170390 n=1 Tax=Delphinapterus leucas TaxID=9749 RepID=A0A7F8K242_DELLE|nr:uncharacterized protein LOC111170390 [Delphinapterus leucas]